MFNTFLYEEKAKTEIFVRNLASITLTKMTEQRLQKELDNVLAGYDLYKLTSTSCCLASFVKSIQENRLADATQNALSALHEGVPSQSVEAAMRLCNSNFWIGAPENLDANLIIRSLFKDMASGVYSTEGSYRKNFDRLPIAKATAIMM